MKKITLLLFALISFWQMDAQVNSYSFVAGTGGVLDPMTSSTQLVASGSDDGVSAVANIGFTFNFAGVDYTQFSANANGIIRLGATAVTSQWTNTAANAALTSPVIMTYWDDLATGTAAGGGKVHYVLTGTAPNQKLIVEWFVTVPRNTTGPANAKFQCVLEETTNKIYFVYGSGLVLNSAFSGYTIGLATSDTLFNTVDATTNTVSQSVFKIDNSIAIPSGTVYTWTPPTCPGSTGLTTTNLTANSATITWTPPSSAPANGYEYVVSSSAVLPTGSGTAEATNSVNVSSLTANTIYYVYVRSICGSDVGNWGSIGTFKTLCNPGTDFVENFDSYSTGAGNLPDCWSKLGTSANVYITTGGAAPMSPANRLYMNISATTTAYAILPPVSNLQADTHRLRFKAYATAANKIMSVGYFTVPGDVTSYVEIEPLQMPSTTLATTQEFTVIPTGIPAGVSQLVLNVFAGTATTIYVDDVKWEVNSSCVEPNTLSASAITNSGADLGWVVGGVETEWEVQYGLNNFALGTGTILSNLTTNSTPVSGLVANTLYQFYVRSVCSGSVYSSWSGPFTFKTQCDDVTEYFENFDSYTTNFSTTLPDCWSRGGTSTSTYITTGSTAPMSASNRLYMFASGTTPTEGYAILPAVSNLQANTHRLKFKAYATLADRFLEVGYLTDASNVNTFVQLEEVTLPGTAVANTQEIVVIPTGIPAGVKHLVIKNPGYPSSSTTAYIDDVAWEVIPACSNPTSVSASAVTSNTASIAWTSDANAVSWEIEYGPTGFTIGTGTVVAAPTNPFTITGLTSETAYQFYVRSVCSGPVTSTESLSGSFTTLCASVIPDYTQDFATFVPNCWGRSDAGDATTGPTGTGTGYWFADGFLNSGTTGAIKANLYLGNRKGWMISPILDLTAGGYQVRYDVGATNYATTTAATMGSDDKVQFLMSTNGGATWTILETFNTANTPTNTSTTKVYDITAQTSSTVLFAFLADEGPVDDPQDWEFFVDNFVVETPPSTPPVCATNIVATPNASCGNYPFTITWDVTPSALGYKINVGTTTGGNDIANNVDLGLTTTYTYSTPNFNTTYYYTVVPYNSVGNATGCTEQSFTTFATGCYCTSAPTSNDGLGITNVQLGTTNFPNGDVTYFDHTATTVTLQQGLSTNVQVSFATGYTYNTYIWIDFNDNLTFEASEIVYSGESLSTNPTILNASFVMPATAALGTHRMRLAAADVMTTANPCYSGSYGVTLDFSVDIVVPSCTPASATATVSADCANNQYFVAVDVTALGSGTPSISDGTNTWPVTATGVVQAGPFASGSSVTLTVLHGSDSTCDLPLGTFNYACPPVNDECTNAIVLTAGGVFADNAVIGTNVAATNSNPPAPGCASFQGGDVWYSVVVPASGSITIETNSNTGGVITDTGMAVYSGTCSSLTLVECDDDDSPDGNFSLIALTGQTPGTTLYVNVWEYLNDSFGTFKISAYDASLSAASFDNASFVAYPNPVKDVLNLSYSTEITSVKVINLLGQEVISRKVGSTSTQLDMSNLTAGAYIVNVTVDDVVKSIKVIKQ